MPLRVAIVDDEPVVCKRLSQALVKEGYAVEAFMSARSFLEAMIEQPFDVVFSDMLLPDMNGLELLPKIKGLKPETEVIIVTGHGTISTAIEAMREGAFHYVTKPVNFTEIRTLARHAQEKIAMRMENTRLREALLGTTGLSSIVGKSPAIQELFSLIRKVAPVDCNVLVQGDSGTGKALVALALHHLSPRRNQPFVTFNCGGFTEELISSELFGYEKGAFTGAATGKIGLLEAASGGTVFLDEVGEMPLSMQVRLLHVLQERRILRVGGTRTVDLDIRVIAATNRDLKAEVEKGNFREDLFFRLNVVSTTLPRLADRREDIPLLVQHFIEKYRLAFRKQVYDLDDQALAALMGYSFPGNVRELENIIERAVALTDSETITPADLPEDIRRLEFDTLEGGGLPTLAEMERRYVIKILEKTGYNKKLAAEVLGMPRTTLWRKLKEYGVE
ncbi:MULTISPECIES: sigma-54-dependent transcriptional regulator [Desulfovibrio]|uniref:Acetoacetate metabolism regulatory protein AtoC n=2 Tax=root TaxID=1 RepID=A0A212KIE9_9BACT|nr:MULTISPECIES: sigma-54 dependent transcriptional regulator [Desulfovibrio]MBD8897109.1 sigma-54-dependent Fis family transcriptional regulator [Desulfovibrio desulfuricans]MBT9750275.1 response regulator [Desulfovibrio desulfuricans]MCB6543117.1 sigma-54 dependent transcriptional regulator [Desulfovibrio desulfuricans]MCB6554196.1 sigma-54 dependent transcriptional regulator [Desulfovibrio desulfuricans]MCB6566142.1 sigma-54 dependent transcriptional regulator [Desulfovibrio desulfuricans]